MFYCDPCAREREWPVSMARSLGRCELCKQKRVCNDVHTSKIPLPKDKAGILLAGKTDQTEEPEYGHIVDLKHKLDLQSFRKQAEEKLTKKN